MKEQQDQQNEALATLLLANAVPNSLLVSERSLETKEYAEKTFAEEMGCEGGLRGVGKDPHSGEYEFEVYANGEASSVFVSREEWLALHEHVMKEMGWTNEEA